MGAQGAPGMGVPPILLRLCLRTKTRSQNRTLWPYWTG